MTETPYAIAHEYALMVPAPDGVDDAISAVFAAHEAELDAALAPFGITMEDLLQPTWMRAVRIGDVEALRSPAAAAAEGMRGAVDEGIAAGVDLLASRYHCCGPGEACSSSGCSGEHLIASGGGWTAPSEVVRSYLDAEACDPSVCDADCSMRRAEAAADEEHMSRAEAIDAGLLTEDGAPIVSPEPRNDAAVFGAPRSGSDRAPKMGTADRGQWGDH